MWMLIAGALMTGSGGVLLYRLLDAAAARERVCYKRLRASNHDP